MNRRFVTTLQWSTPFICRF